MAIKGKKKSQSRGSQGQRRPAAAPRPVYTGRKHVPWYKKTEGRLIGGMLIAVVVGVTIWLVADAQNKSRERTETREALEEYVDTVRSFTNSLGPVAEAMGEIPPSDPDADALRRNARTWNEDLSAAQAQIAAVPPPDEAEVASRLFEQSLSSYLAAVRTYQSAADADGELQVELLAQATAAADQGRALFDLGVVALDEELQDVGGENSNLLLPQSQPQTPEPGQSPGGSTQTITIPGSGGGGGGGQGGGGAGGGGGDQGDGN
ncbi:MAG TPA: hypothetical protein VHJ76_03435 [Actinomycetota bacterium]|nr:hypothetical protein [Actinomycetota bacterium]